MNTWELISFSLVLDGASIVTSAFVWRNDIVQMQNCKKLVKTPKSRNKGKFYHQYLFVEKAMEDKNEHPLQSIENGENVGERYSLCVDE